MHDVERPHFPALPNFSGLDFPALELQRPIPRRRRISTATARSAALTVSDFLSLLGFDNKLLRAASVLCLFPSAAGFLQLLHGVLL